MNMSAKNIEYITNPSNYVGANPRDKYGQHTKGVYAPIQVDWNTASKVQVTNDGTNNVFTSQDKYGNTLYSGTLSNGWALATDTFEGSMSGGVVKFTIKSNELFVVDNNGTASVILYATENAKIKATCNSTSPTQIVAKDHAIVDITFNGGNFFYSDTSYIGAVSSNNQSMVNLKLTGNFASTPAIALAANDNSVMNIVMTDTAQIGGGANERGGVECRQNATINMFMKDNSKIIRTGSNQSYFGLNVMNSSNINLIMQDNAKMQIENWNCYAVNVAGTQGASVDITMSGNSVIQCGGGGNSRAIHAYGGDYRIKLKDNATITCNGQGGSSCYSIGAASGNAGSSHIELTLMDNASVNNGKTSGKTGNFADIVSGAMGGYNNEIVVLDNRAVNSTNATTYAINNGYSRNNTLNYKGSGKANGTKAS